MRGLPKILSLIRDKLNKFNNTATRLLGSIYCMTLKLLLDPDRYSNLFLNAYIIRHVHAKYLKMI